MFSERKTCTINVACKLTTMTSVIVISLHKLGKMSLYAAHSTSCLSSQRSSSAEQSKRMEVILCSELDEVVCHDVITAPGHSDPPNCAISSFLARDIKSMHPAVPTAVTLKK